MHNPTQLPLSLPCLHLLPHRFPSQHRMHSNPHHPITSTLLGWRSLSPLCRRSGPKRSLILERSVTHCTSKPRLPSTLASTSGMLSGCLPGKIWTTGWQCMWSTSSTESTLSMELSLTTVQRKVVPGCLVDPSLSTYGQMATSTRSQQLCPPHSTSLTSWTGWRLR